MNTILTLISLMMSQLLHAAVSVGPVSDGDCQFNDLQSAISSGDLTIRLSNEETFVDNIVLNGQNFQLQGGYNNCSDANNGLAPTSIPTEIMALDPSSSVITVNGMGSASDVTLSTLKISGTVNASGLMISQLNGDITLMNTEISNNNDDNGGGVFVSGQNSHLIAINSIIQDNIANINGGGIYCVNAQLTLDARTLVRNNQVFGTVPNRGRGGGLFADDCIVDIYSGHSDGVSAGFIANQPEKAQQLPLLPVY